MFYKFIVSLIINISFVIICEASSQAKIPIRSSKIVETQLFDSFNAVGQVKFEQSRTYYANIEGRVDDIPVKKGGKVKAGTIILVIDRSIAEAQKNQSESNFKFAQLAFERSKTLFEKKFTSDESLQNSKVKLEEARTNLAKANLTYGDMVIAAPFTGEVGVIGVRLGDMVKKGDYLFSLINKKNMSIFLELPETLYGKISDKTEVILNDASGATAKGYIVATTPYLSDKGTLSVEVGIDGENHFIHGSYLNALFIFNKHKGLAIPERAVLKNESGNFIYIVGPNDTVKQLYVKLGTRTNNMIEIYAEGISEGTLIVLEGLTKVQDGAKVEILN